MAAERLQAIADGLKIASTWVSGPRAAKLQAYADELEDIATAPETVVPEPPPAPEPAEQHTEGDNDLTV